MSGQAQGGLKLPGGDREYPRLDQSGLLEGDGPIGLCRWKGLLHLATHGGHLKLFDLPPGRDIHALWISRGRNIGRARIECMCEEVGEERAFRDFNQATLGPRIFRFATKVQETSSSQMERHDVRLTTDVDHPRYTQADQSGSPGVLVVLDSFARLNW